jgi:phage terminase large subunit GpA-like protein
MLSSAISIRRDVAPLLKPPQRLSVSDACEDFVWVHTPGGFSGAWETPKYMKRPMNLISGREYQGIVFIGPAQSAKTFALVECAMAYNIMHMHADMSIIQTTEKVAGEFSNTRVERLFRHSRGLKELLVRNNVFDKSFKAGHAIYIGHPTVAALSGKTLKVVVLTDYDRMPPDLGGEGTAWQLAFNRIKAFKSRGKCIAESSPKGRCDDPKAKILSSHHYPAARGITSLYHQGTMEQWYWPCPHCEEFFQCRATLDPSYVYIPDCGGDLKAASEQSGLICQNPDCKKVIDLHTHKTEMNSLGEWVGFGQEIDKHGVIRGDLVNSDTASFGLAGWAAQFQGPRQLILKYLQAMKEYEESDDDTELMTVCNTQLGTTLQSVKMDKANLKDDIQNRAKNSEEQKMWVPEEVRYLKASIDVQGGALGKKRFVVQVVGEGVKGEKWLIDRFNIRKTSGRQDDEGNDAWIEPGSYPEDWDEIGKQVMDKVYPLVSGKGFMPIKVTGCDQGGEEGVSDNAYKYYRKIKLEGKARKFLLLKGGSSVGAEIFKITNPNNSKRKDRKAKVFGDIPLAILNTDKLKDITYNRLGREAEGPGFIHFPAWLGEWFFDELTYEERDVKGHWFKPGKGNNEAFDLLGYDHALTIHLKADKTTFWDMPPPWAKEQDENPDIVRDKDDTDNKVAEVPARSRRGRKVRFR